MTTTLVIIMGQGQTEEGDWLGLKTFTLKMAKTYGVIVKFYPHDEPNLFMKLLVLGKLIVVAHSFGGYELLTNVLPFLHTRASSIIVLDPKPKPFLRWLNPLYRFPLPVNTDRFRDFYGGFGRPFEGLKNSVHLGIGHAQFPSDPFIQAFIESEIVLVTGASE